MIKMFVFKLLVFSFFTDSFMLRQLHYTYSLKTCISKIFVSIPCGETFIKKIIAHLKVVDISFNNVKGVFFLYS